MFFSELEINSLPELLAPFDMKIDEFSILLHLSQANSLRDLINTLGLQDYAITEKVGAKVKFTFFVSLNEQKQWCISTKYGELVVQMPHGRNLGSFSLITDDSENNYDEEENCLALFYITKSGSFFNIMPKGIDYIQKYKDASPAEENETSELILFPVAAVEKAKIRDFLRELEVPLKYIADEIDEEVIRIQFPKEGLPCKLGMLSFEEVKNSEMSQACSTFFYFQVRIQKKKFS